MIFQLLTLFPERYRYFLESGLPSRGLKKALLELRFRQLRHFADPRRPGRVDDLPYGGGPGMVLEVGPIHRALKSLPATYPVVFFTPRGKASEPTDGAFLRHISRLNASFWIL